MSNKLFRNASFLKNLRFQKRNSSYNHHLSPVQVDVVNHNSMDFLPKPKGSWKEVNDKRQQVNNMTLIVGALVFVSGVVGTWSSLWSDVLWSPPKTRINKDFSGAKFVN